MPDYHAILTARARECHVTACAYRVWLSSLRPFNLVLVVGAAVLSTVAGATILAAREHATLAASLALTSAVLTVVHTKLDCDAHQAECRRLQSAYDALACRYRCLDVADEPEDIKSRLRQLDSSQATLRSETKAVPPNWAIGRAEKQFATG